MYNLRISGPLLLLASAACGPGPELDDVVDGQAVQVAGTPGKGLSVRDVSASRAVSGEITVNYFVENEGTTTSAPLKVAAYYREISDCVREAPFFSFVRCTVRTYRLGTDAVPAIPRAEWAPAGMPVYFNGFVGRRTAAPVLMSSAEEYGLERSPRAVVQVLLPGQTASTPGECSGACASVRALPDLSPLSAGAVFTAATRSVRLNFRVRNGGEARSGDYAFVSQIFLSRDAELDRTDIPLDESSPPGNCGTSIPPLAVGATASAWAECVVPYYAQGTYYVIAAIDGMGSDVPELDERNNIIVSDPIVLPAVPRQVVRLTLDDYRLTTNVGAWRVSDHVGNPPLGISFEIGASTTAWWQFDPILVGPAGARYRVEVRHSGAPNRPTAVVHQVIEADGTVTSVTIDQTQNAGAWISLGEYFFERNLGNHVRILAANQPGKVTGVNAVRFVPLP